MISKILSLIRMLAGLHKLPKSFRKFIKEHGDEPITSLEIVRTPLDRVPQTLLNVLTLGDWDNIKKRANVDQLVHTGLIVNDKYTLEKLAVPSFKVGRQNTNEHTESLQIPVKPLAGGKDALTIAEFVEGGMKQMGNKYYTYDGFNNNCQDFIGAHLRAGALLTAGIAKFLKQDITELIKETPELSRLIGRQITDIAGEATKAYEELAYKRGGVFDTEPQASYARDRLFGGKNKMLR